MTRLPDAILSLKSHKVDAVVIEKPVAEAYLKQNKELTLASVKFNEDKKSTVIAIPKDSPEVMAHINKSIKDVKDHNLIDKYMDKASKEMSDDGNFLLNMAVSSLKV